MFLSVFFNVLSDTQTHTHTQGCQELGQALGKILFWVSQMTTAMSTVTSSTHGVGWGNNLRLSLAEQDRLVAFPSFAAPGPMPCPLCPSAACLLPAVANSMWL